MEGSEAGYRGGGDGTRDISSSSFVACSTCESPSPTDGPSFPSLWDTVIAEYWELLVSCRELIALMMGSITVGASNHFIVIVVAEDQYLIDVGSAVSQPGRALVALGDSQITPVHQGHSQYQIILIFYIYLTSG